MDRRQPVHPTPVSPPGWPPAAPSVAGQPLSTWGLGHLRLFSGWVCGGALMLAVGVRDRDKDPLSHLEGFGALGIGVHHLP